MSCKMPDQQLLCMCARHVCRQVAFVKRGDLYLCVFCYKELRAEEEGITIKELETKWEEGTTIEVRP